MSTPHHRLPTGTWVEVERCILPADERAAALPPETRRHPYVMRVHGFLTADAAVGEDATVRSLIGHEHRGTVTDAAPEYTHSFGATMPELLRIGLVTPQGGEHG